MTFEHARSTKHPLVRRYGSFEDSRFHSETDLYCALRVPRHAILQSGKKDPISLKASPLGNDCVCPSKLHIAWFSMMLVGGCYRAQFRPWKSVNSSRRTREEAYGATVTAPMVVNLKIIIVQRRGCNTIPCGHTDEDLLRSACTPNSCTREWERTKGWRH